eukprot:256487_1
MSIRKFKLIILALISLVISAVIFVEHLDILYLLSNGVYEPKSNDDIKVIKQDTFNRYVDYLSSNAKNIPWSRWHSNYLIQNNSSSIHFLRISKQFIINTLSNKTIILFGDSLPFYLLNYILNTIFWCCDYQNTSNLNIASLNSATAGLYCRHLIPNKTLILNTFGKDVIMNREHLMGILPLLGDQKTLHGSFEHGRMTSSVHLKRYNMTFHLYYKWGPNMKDADEMMSDYTRYIHDVPFDIMINNMGNMHGTHGFPTFKNNPNFMIQFIRNMERYMNQMIALKKKEQCLIFGPTNPVLVIPPFWDSRDAHQFWSIQRELLFGMIDDGPLNGTLHTLPSVLKNVHSKGNYLDVNISTSILSDAQRLLLSKCQKFLFKMSLNDTKEVNNICVLYYWGLGSNVIHERMKRLVDNRNVNDKVYYNDRYSIYTNITALSSFVHSNVHYPQLLPIAWTQLMNIISNGC